jgi:hypothetical protein
MQTGCLVVLELSDSWITDLIAVRDELQEAIEEFAGTEIQTELVTELIACDADLQQRLRTILASLQPLLPDTDMDTNPIALDHPIRTEPFLFSRLPVVGKTPIQIFHQGGLVLVLGELSAAWGLDRAGIDRETVRSAQELGINLLHYGWRRHTLTQLQLQLQLQH